MDLINKNVYVIKIDLSTLAGRVYIKYLTLKYLINSQAEGFPYIYIFTTKNEAENLAKRLNKKMGYIIKRNYKK